MDTSEVLYSEKQKFTQPWLWALLIGIVAVVIFGIVQEIIAGHNLGLIAAIIIPVLVVALLASCQLETHITREGVHFRFAPFHLQMQTIKWSEIKSAYVREYRPLAEFGGWGIRYNFSGGRAYNVRGNMGLQLELTNGKKVLIGTQYPGELSAVINSLGIR